MRVILAYLMLCVWCYSSENSDVLEQDKNGYAFYYPLTMEYKQNANVCLEIDEHLLPGKVKISIQNVTCSTGCESHIINAGFSCWQITVPDEIEGDRYYPSKIKVEIETKNTNIKFSGEEDVQVVGHKVKVFTETDRKVYKMGDIVKIRFLALAFDLKPVKDYKISSFHIRSPYPSATIVKQWQNISTNSGLAQVEFQLAPDTPEGQWFIIGDGIYASFEVKKYILPRFQVSIDGPDRIYEGVESVSYLVCGKYSYGRNLKGTALLTLKFNYWEESLNLSKTKQLKSGCAKFEIFGEELALKNRSLWIANLNGAITEDSTDQVESGTKHVYINREPYTIDWDFSNRYIKPELPHKVKFSLKDVQIPLKPPCFEFCYRIAWEEYLACSNFTLDSDNTIMVTIPPLKNISDSKNIRIEIKNENFPTNNPIRYLYIWHSTSQNAIKVFSKESNSKECGSTLSFIVLYNSGRFKNGENIEFKYILSSRNEILEAGSVLHEPKKQNLNLNDYPNVIGKEYYELNDNPIDTFDFEFELGIKVYTDSRLLVYYDYDSEVISDMIDISVTKCGPNMVKANWTESPLYPGEVGKLNIKTDSESLCSVTSIDRASKFLGSSDYISTDTVISGFYRHYYTNKLNCIKPEKSSLDFADYYYYSSKFDSFDSFKALDIGIISNMKFISKTCEVSRPIFPLHTTGLGGFAGGFGPITSPATTPAVAIHPTINSNPVSDDRGSAVRTFFPETWLWDLVLVTGDGEITVERKLPDSITDWVGNVLCVSSNKGFGISDNIEMRAFKPFFVDILLPYSIKRNKEVLHLQIPIFNYLNYSLPIRVILQVNDDIVLIDGEEKRSFSMCLGADDSYIHTYRIKSSKIGYSNITVSADVDPSYVENCAPDSIIRRRDVVQKSILVEPEGYSSSLLKGTLLCANESSGPDNIEWQINLPENIVLDTVNGKVIINSDILGPMFQNLENILVVPTGCGEQTMATLSPNLYVLKYLEANNALTDSSKQKILKNLEIGYQRMLNYVHDDGSFSAFGKTDPEGSMFLTAFVIRTFKQMEKYIFIDDDVINKAVKWIIEHQLENGCFDPVHHVFHEMGLASSKNQTTALTSYVLISIMETDVKIDDNVFSQAKGCLLNDKTFDKYTMAISSYALGLMNLTKDAQERLDKLLELSDNLNGSTWWTQTEQSLSANVEVSSYAIISLLQQSPNENIGIVSPIVRWLQSQMNPNGGFFSTQDTVVGLDAISRYATLVNKDEPNVNISIATRTDTKELQITKRDRANTDVIPLTAYPNKIEARISGNGCVSVQTVINYYLDKPLLIDDLKLDITLKPVYQKLKCSVIELKPCVSYSTPGQINMAIVEVTLFSGFAPDQSSLYELTSSSTTGVKKFEQIKNQVVFYLTQLNANEVCLPFKIEENLIVEDIANATVKLYDYYKPEVSVSKSFSLDDCATNIAVET